MSQAGIINTSSGPVPPEVATSYVTDSGTAVPNANVLDVLGSGSITTTGATNVVTVELTGLTSNSILYGQGTTTIGKVTPVNDGVLITGNTGVPSLLSNGTTGQVLTATTGSPPSWQSVPVGVSLSPYIVGPTESDYTTIQAAINAAHGAGASSSNPYNIYIKPQSGGYSENLTLYDGINLIGFSAAGEDFTNGLNPGSLKVTGSVTFNDTSASTVYSSINNLTFVANSLTLFTSTFTNSNIVFLTLTGVGVEFTGSGSALIDCISSGGSTGTFSFNTDNFSLIDETGDASGKFTTQIDATLSCWCSFKNSQIYMTGSATAVSTDDLQFIFTECPFIQTKVSASTISSVQTVSSSFTTSTFTSTNDGFITCYNTAFYSSTLSWPANESHYGNYNFYQCVLSQTSYTFSPNLVNCSGGYSPQQTTTLQKRNNTNQSGDYNITLQDDVVFMTNGHTLTLPSTTITSVSATFVGVSYTIVSDASTSESSPVTISGNGNNINGSSTYLITTPSTSVNLFFNGAQWITLFVSSGSSTNEFWQTISASQTLAVNNGYICISPGGALALALPSTSVIGDIIEVTLSGATSWSITQGSLQSIVIGNKTTTVGAGGSLTSTANGDSLRMVCTVANTTWSVLSSMGNITVV